MDPNFINPNVLAYLGDSVLELMVREYLVRDTSLAKPKELQTAALDFVSAVAHMNFMMYAIDNKILTEEEIDIYKRGRNTKNTKTETKEHRHSTGFEAIIGHLYLNNELQRIDEIFKAFKDFVDETKVKQN